MKKTLLAALVLFGVLSGAQAVLKDFQVVIEDPFTDKGYFLASAQVDVDPKRPPENITFWEIYNVHGTPKFYSDEALTKELTSVEAILAAPGDVYVKGAKRAVASSSGSSSSSSFKSAEGSSSSSDDSGSSSRSRRGRGARRRQRPAARGGGSAAEEAAEEAYKVAGAFGAPTAAAVGDEYPIEIREGMFSGFDINVTGDMTIEQLKKKIYRRNLMPVNEQVLMLNGQLANDRKLADCGIDAGSKVVLLRRIGGRVVHGGDGGGGGGGPAGPVYPRAARRGQISGRVVKATLGGIALALAGYISIRTYQKQKNKIAREYKLGNLTKLQDHVWIATKAASYRMPWFLNKLVRNNPGKTLTDFAGNNPRALAHFYYGHAPSQREYDAFIARFFSGVPQ